MAAFALRLRRFNSSRRFTCRAARQALMMADGMCRRRSQANAIGDSYSCRDRQPPTTSIDGHRSRPRIAIVPLTRPALNRGQTEWTATCRVRSRGRAMSALWLSLLRFADCVVGGLLTACEPPLRSASCSRKVSTQIGTKLLVPLFSRGQT